MDSETQVKIEKTFKALEKEYLASLSDFESKLNRVTFTNVKIYILLGSVLSLNLGFWIAILLRG